MSVRLVFSARGWGRRGLIWLALWLALEILLMKLVAARIGWGGTIALMAVKGGLGLALIGWLGARSLRKFRDLGSLRVESAGLSGLFTLLSAILLALPGLVPMLLAIVLFAPSVRLALVRRFASAAAPADPREIDLSEGEWREIRTRKLTKRSRERKASLETGPPSV